MNRLNLKENFFNKIIIIFINELFNLIFNQNILNCLYSFNIISYKYKYQ